MGAGTINNDTIFVEMVDKEVGNYFFIDSALLFDPSQSIFLGNCDKNCSLKLFGKLPEWLCYSF